jgi:hypothetical protein
VKDIDWLCIAFTAAIAGRLFFAVFSVNRASGLGDGRVECQGSILHYEGNVIKIPAWKIKMKTIRQ